MKSIAVVKQIFICILVLVVAGAVWTSRDRIAGLWPTASAENGRAETGDGGTPVIVALAEPARDDVSFSAIGTGFAMKSVTIRAPASGLVAELNIAPGREFTEGDVLLRLDDADQRLAVNLAEARLERARSDRERFEQLQTTGAAATIRLEDAQTAYTVAAIELEQSIAELEDRVIVAPFDGISGLAAVEVGDRIALSDPVASFDDRSSLLVEFDLPEALLFRVAPGLSVTASTPALPNRDFDGRVSAVDSRLDAASRTARVRAIIENDEDLLRPGASFAVRLDLPGPEYVSVPELALQFSDGSLHVWRVSEGVAEMVEVEMIRRRAGRVIVDGPLEAKDAIVVEGTQRLRTGAPVVVLNAQTGAAS